MKKEHAFDFLNRRKSLGLQLNTPESDCVGWIMVKKQLPNQRLLDLFSNDPEDSVFKAEKLNYDKPFWVNVVELPRNIFEADVYPENEDYRRSDIYRFYNIYEVEECLQSLGKNLTDLKWLTDIDFF